MTVLTHAVIGGLAGSLAPNPFLSALFGFLSHFLSDIIPHNDYLYFYYGKPKNPYTSVINRIILGLTALYLLAIILSRPASSSLPIVLGSFFGILPDILTGLGQTFFKRETAFDKFHGLTHWRLALGEFLHNKLSRSEKIDRRDFIVARFDQLKNSRWARLGWTAETAFELIVLFYCLRLLGFGI
ncbi:MAG: hypothetical protein M1352_00890 [Patescibacteria group bacterium]|nr:hypothetical protein [Patescibacteria group bacterium]